MLQQIDSDNKIESGITSLKIERCLRNKRMIFSTRREVTVSFSKSQKEEASK